MATFTSKFGIGDRVYLPMEVSYYKTPTIYEVHNVTFTDSEIVYCILTIYGDRIQRVVESKLALMEE
jgi:hypothetical protein